MLHIVLLILKIIGIVLGVLTGIVLLALCLALFVPVHYRIEAKRTEGEGNPPVEAKIKITWLFHFINVRLLYPAEVYLRARILFITVFRLPKKQKKAGKKSKRDKKTKQSESEEKDKKAKQSKNEESDKKDGQSGNKEGDNKSGQNESKETNQDVIDAAEKEQQAEHPKDSEGSASAQKEDSKAAQKEDGKAEYTVKEGPAEDKEKLSLKERIIKICKFLQNIWYTITGICDKIKTIWENIEYYLDILQSDTFKQAFSLCKGELISILSYIKPRKFNADLVIGMGDPASTGQILSYYGILYPLVGNYVTVEGDFENKRIEGTVFIKGKMKLFTFLKTAVRIYFNKDIRKLLKLFKKEDV